MMAWLRSKPVKLAAWSMPIVLLLFGAFWVHLLNQVGADDWIERRFLQLASHSASTGAGGDLLLIHIDPARTEGLGDYDDGITANQKWRATHALLLEKLLAAQARIVVFDLSFPAVSAQYTRENTRFVNAVRAANGAGKTRALVGFERDMDPNPELESVLPREKMGLISMRELTYDLANDQYLARVLLAESTVSLTALGAEEHVVLPLPMPLTMYLADQEPTRGTAMLSIDPDRGGIAIRWQKGESTFIQTEVRVCERGSPGCALPPKAAAASMLRRAVLPLWMGRALDFTDRSYASVLNQAKLGDNYRDRVVLVGALTPGEKQQIGPGAPQDDVYGMHVHARVFSDLVNSTYPRHAAPRVQLFCLALLILLGALARLYMPVQSVSIPFPFFDKFKWPVGFLIVFVLFLFAMALVFQSTYVFFDLGYQVLALIAGYAIPRLAGLVKLPPPEEKKGHEERDDG